jgi:hypothetical protein
MYMHNYRYWHTFILIGIILFGVIDRDLSAKAAHGCPQVENFLDISFPEIFKASARLW